MKKLGKEHIKGLKILKGSEVYYLDWGLVGVEYPYIWHDGKKIKLKSNEWLKLYNQYWYDPNGEGYWILKEAKKEFTPEYIKMLNKMK